MLEMQSRMPWAMTQRILTELDIAKFFLGIPGHTPAAVAVSGKRPIDVYNKLSQISSELDLLNTPVTPSEVYSEVRRLNEDVNVTLRFMRIIESAVPPVRRRDLQPRDSLAAVLGVLDEIGRIQRSYGIKPVDFKALDKGDKTVPDDLLMMVELTLTEFQRIKAQLGMMHNITPPSVYSENKKPDDVVQLLGYIANKLREIESR
jgi:hypothetical protein